MLNIVHRDQPTQLVHAQLLLRTVLPARFGQFTLVSDEGPQRSDPLGCILFYTTAKSRKVSNQLLVHGRRYTIGGDVDILLQDLRTGLTTFSFSTHTMLCTY